MTMILECKLQLWRSSVGRSEELNFQNVICHIDSNSGESHETCLNITRMFLKHLKTISIALSNYYFVSQ